MAQTNGIGSQPLLNNLIDRTERSSGAGPAAEAKGLTATNTEAQPDAAKLSGTGSSLAAASSTSDVRADKVAALKSAIDAGTYSVPAADVADKLIRNMLE